MFLIDSHCHLDKLNYNYLHKNIDDVLKKANINNVKFFLSVSINLKQFTHMVNLIGERNNVKFSCGIHPSYTNDICDFNALKMLSKNKYVIALGETGLDYLNKHTINISNQKKSFREHIRIGIKNKKPIIIHTRNAIVDTINILYEEHANKSGLILHCFTENKEIAKKLLDYGCYISLSGILTFKKSLELQNTVKYLPLDRILLETDSPYLSPTPFRNKENQPAYIYNIAKYVANLKNISLDYVAETTTQNFSKLFNLKLFI
ncbi:MAG: YchF/TatD family DNA exonuclease [Enterobacterales bacterium]